MDNWTIGCGGRGSKGPGVQRSKGPRVQRSKGPRVQVSKGQIVQGSMDHWTIGPLDLWTLGLRPPLTPQKTYKNQWIFNISAFWPLQPRPYMHHACHLMPKAPMFSSPLVVSRVDFLQKQHFSSNVSHSWNATAPFDSFKNAFKTYGFSTFSLFGPTKPIHICITPPSPLQKLTFLLFPVF